MSSDLDNVSDAVLHSLSSADLKALSEGNLEGVSKEGLTAISTGKPTHTLLQTLDAAAGSLAQGLSLGWADELAGGLHALGANGKLFDPNAYDEYMAASRAQKQDFKQAHPVADLGLKGAGAIATTIATGGAGDALAGDTLGARMLSGARTGAVYGGINGAGDGEGLGGRVNGALWGAGLGAGGGALLPPVISGVARGAGWVGNAAGQAARAVLPQPLIETAGQAADRLSAPLRAAGRLFGGVAGPQPTTAQGRILDSLAADRVTPQQLADYLAANPGSNVDHLTLADLPGLVKGTRETATARLGRSINTAGGAPASTVADALDARTLSQTERVVADLNNLLGVPRTGSNAVATGAEARAARQAAANRAYSAEGGAFDPAVDNVPTSDAVKQVLTQNPLYAKIHAAETNANNATVPVDKRVPHLFEVDPAGNPVLDENGLPRLVRNPTTRDVDLIKRANDEQVYGNSIAKKTGKPNWSDAEVRNRADASEELLKAADEANPVYGAARKKFATDTELMSAHEEGGNFLQDALHQGLVESKIAKMTPEALQQYRLGLVQSVANALGNKASANAFNAVLNSPNKQAALRAVFPSPVEAARFEAMLQNELRMARTRDVVLGGSQTANKAADSLHDVGALMSAAHGSPHGIAGLVNRAYEGLQNSEPVRQDIATELFMKQGPRLQEALDTLAKMQRARANMRSVNRGLAGGAGGAGTDYLNR